MHELADGAVLGIAESIAAGRRGRKNHAAIAQEETVTIDWFRCGQAGDPVLTNAMAWLLSKSSI